MSQATTFSQTAAILDLIAPTPAERAALADRIRAAAPRMTSDVDAWAGFKLFYEKDKAFDALSDDDKLLHYGLTLLCHGNDNVAVRLADIQQGDAATLAVKRGQLRDTLVHAFETTFEPWFVEDRRREQINTDNAHIMRAEMLTGDNAGTLGVFSQYGDTEPSLGFKALEIGNRRVTAEQLVAFVQQHGTEVAPPTTHGVSADAISRRPETGFARGAGNPPPRPGFPGDDERDGPMDLKEMDQQGLGGD